ncbi:4632_t:CDS:2 [Dentiscutata erythropus]|uniref:4632_t:CDS:1 n=1 Tax=Dentiscutata erythropus TaxID=1348616 RepID=A0A9N9CEI5_9GLOM|nr:4632_t:CDS:2 [Dentiscutata erythropus]
MPPNPPEEFSPVTVSAYAPGLDSTPSPIYPPKRSTKRRTTNPFKTSAPFVLPPPYNPAQPNISNLQSLDFTPPYKSNSLLGQLRQKYEVVGRRKTNPTITSKPLSERTLDSINSIFNLLSLFTLDTLKFVIYCLLWYASSAVTNNIGKQILNQFNYPVTLTWVQFGFVSLYCYVIGHGMGFTRLRSPTTQILHTTLPLSLFSITGHVFSSMATSIVPVSFVHTIKALSPLFTVIFYRFGFKVNYSYPVYTSLIPLTIGVMLACSSSSTGSFIGFLFALSSTVIFVAQNIFSKKILFNQGNSNFEKRKLDELNVSFYSSLMAFSFMTPIWLYYDGFPLLVEHFWSYHSIHSSNTSNGWTIAFYFWLNGTSHFAQNILALSILSITSPVTYSIASLVKRIFVITASIIWFGQRTTFVQA